LRKSIEKWSSGIDTGDMAEEMVSSDLWGKLILGTGKVFDVVDYA
jgi:hypothetical protein